MQRDKQKDFEDAVSISSERNADGREWVSKSYIEGDSQTKATAKWQKKKGLISKSYKLPRDIVDAFAEACESNDISQAAQLTKYMRGYIKRSGIEI